MLVYSSLLRLFQVSLIIMENSSIKLRVFKYLNSALHLAPPINMNSTNQRAEKPYGLLTAMAQSRLHKFANIFHRVEGFLRSGVIKSEDKPIWYDVCTRFQPHVLPDFLRPAPEGTVKPIFYHEDKIRAEFYRVFGSPGIIDLMDGENKPICEQFIHQYIEIAKSSQDDLDDVTLFKLTARRLEDTGVRLRGLDGEEPKSSQRREQKSRLNVANLLNE